MEVEMNEINTENQYIIVGIPLYNSEETIGSIILSCSKYVDGLPSVVDETTGEGVPGFTGVIGIVALIGATIFNHKKKKNLI